ncbi:hypothetical protein BDW74DRAFT_158945, partial [Aspergillus multicolor]|uniref:uncharacterized protein n=1 Tax=Aspergillus multicolor TaxID=41759 RepID=UPI003CCD4B3A
MMNCKIKPGSGLTKRLCRSKNRSLRACIRLSSNGRQVSARLDPSRSLAIIHKVTLGIYCLQVVLRKVHIRWADKFTTV